MKTIFNEQFVEDKRSGNIVKITSYYDKYKVEDKDFMLFDYDLEEYVKKEKYNGR